MSDGVLRAVLVRPDGSFVSLQNPARIGEVIRMYATGLGQTSPPIITDQMSRWSRRLRKSDTEDYAGYLAGSHRCEQRRRQVISAQYAYGLVGVYEVQFQVESAKPAITSRLPS